MSFHVRRKDREVTDPQVLKSVLKSTKYITIAMCRDAEPYLVSLSHGYDEAANCLYFHCASEGKKLVYLKANCKVWGQAMLDYGVTDECDYDYTSVQFQGKVTLLQGLGEKRHAMEVLVRQLSANPEEKLAKIKPEKLEATVMGRIDIECLTGKMHRTKKP
jgi:uncharacterized protein